MRKASCMNDFMEVDHGLQCLIAAYNSDIGKKLKEALDHRILDFSKNFEDLFDGWIPHLKSDTFLTCISEHLDSEDRFGRLSMWRAYGHGIGVGIVLNNSAILSPSDALKAHSSPVAYLSDEEFGREFEILASNIMENLDWLIKIGQNVSAWMFEAFKYAALCTKHPGFKEELEWRIVYLPTLEKSDKLVKSTEVISGIPQPVYKYSIRELAR